MGQFQNDRVVVLITNRMKTRGVDLWRFIGQIGRSWPETPMGFSFTCKDMAAYKSLGLALIQSPNFGTDDMLSGSLSRGASYREVSQPDSLHVILSSRSDSTDPVGATCSIHLDSVSIVTGKDSKTKQVNYDIAKAAQHLLTDAKHTPLLISRSEDGIKVGFRF